MSDGDVIYVDTEAEAYVILVKAALPHAAINQGELRKWWAEAANSRRELGLTQAQVIELQDFCRALVWQLPEGEAPAPEREDRSRRRPQNRRRGGR